MCPVYYSNVKDILSISKYYKVSIISFDHFVGLPISKLFFNLMLVSIIASIYHNVKLYYAQLSLSGSQRWQVSFECIRWLTGWWLLPIIMSKFLHIILFQETEMHLYHSYYFWYWPQFYAQYKQDKFITE